VRGQYRANDEIPERKQSLRSLSYYLKLLVGYHETGSNSTNGD
jgi:hypothetical protein